MKLTKLLPLGALLALLSVFLAVPSAEAADSLPGASSQVNVISIGGTTVGVTNGMPSRLTDGTSYYVGAKTGQFPTSLGQTTMTGSVSVAIASNQSTLPANIAQVNGSTLASSNPLFDQLSDGTSTYVAAKTGQFPSALGQGLSAASLSVVLASDYSLPVTTGAPTGANNGISSATNIASAGTTAVVCKSGLSASTPLKIYRVRVSGAALARCTIRYNDNGTFTNFSSLMTSAVTPTAEVNFPGGFAKLTTSATATTQQIEANCNNFDAAAQDFWCDTSYCQASSGC